MADVQKPGIFTRAAQAVNYMISGVTPSTWFGPMQPLAPMAPPSVKGRAFDYLFGWNLQYIPRASEAVDFQTLKRVAETCDIARLLIETRKDRMAVIDWEVRPKELEKGKRPKGSKFKTQIDEVSAMLKSPDRRLAWGQWLKEVLEQNLVIDAVSVYRRKTRSGKPYAWELIDGATIKTLFDADGRAPLPPSPAYQQVLKGIPAANYATWDTGDMLYYPENPRVDRGYGYSRVEQALRYINLQLARVRSQLGWYEEGNVPEGFIEAPAEMTLEQVRTMQEWWDSVVSGIQAVQMRRRVWWLPQGSKYQPMKEAVLKSEFDEWIARVLCFAFSEDPTPFVKQANRATAQTAQEKAEAEGLLPSMLYVKRLINTLIELDFGYTDIEFAWSLDNEFDPVKKATIDNIYARAGIKSIDEVRESIGEEPLGGAYAVPMIATVTGYLPVDPHEAAELAQVRAPQLPDQSQQNGNQDGKGQDDGKGKGTGSGKGGKAGERSSPKTRGAGGESASVGSGSGGERTAKAAVPIEVGRHVLNAHELTSWAYKAITPSSEILGVDEIRMVSGVWSEASDPEQQPSMIHVEGGPRTLKTLPDGRLALFFHCVELEARWGALAGDGVSYDFTERPHVPLTRGAAAVVLEQDATEKVDEPDAKTREKMTAYLVENGARAATLGKLNDEEVKAAYLAAHELKKAEKGPSLTPAAPYAGALLMGPEEHWPWHGDGVNQAAGNTIQPGPDLNQRQRAQLGSFGSFPGPTPETPAWKMRKVTREELSAAADAADREPSLPQIRAGNYVHGHFKHGGLQFTIENAAGSKRRGVGADGKAWEVTMPVPYGYVRQSTGADGEHIDVYFGPNPDSDTVWVVDQVDAETGAFDEHKVFAFFDSWSQAQAAYIAAFSDGRAHERLGHVSSMSFDAFKTWLGEPQTEPRSMVQKRDYGEKLHRLRQRRGETCEPDCPVCKSVTVGTGLVHHDLRGARRNLEVGKSRRPPFVLKRDGTATDLAKQKRGRRRLPPAPFATPQARKAEAQIRTVLAAAFKKLRAAVAAQVRTELAALRKAQQFSKAAGDEDDPDWILAGKIAERLELEGLSFVIDETESALNLTASTAGQATLGAIGLDDQGLVDQLDRAAANWARDRSAELVGMRYDRDGNLVESRNAEMRIDESTRDMVREVLYQGMVEGKRSTEIADDLERGSAEADYPFSEERAALIANTEIRRAHAEGSLEGMRAAADAGVKVKKEWISSGHETVCDDCRENEEQGAIDVDEEFASGDDAPPGHPDCNCDVVASVEEEAAAASEADSEKAATVYAEAARLRADLLAKVLERARASDGARRQEIAKAAGLEMSLAAERRAREDADARSRAADEARKMAEARIFMQEDVDAQRTALVAILGEHKVAMAGAVDAAIGQLREAVQSMEVATTKRLELGLAGTSVEMLIERLADGRHRVMRTERPNA